MLRGTPPRDRHVALLESPLPPVPIQPARSPKSGLIPTHVANSSNLSKMQFCSDVMRVYPGESGQKVRKEWACVAAQVTWLLTGQRRMH